MSKVVVLHGDLSWWGKLYHIEPEGKYFGLCWPSYGQLQLLNAVTVVQRQPETIFKHVGMATFQQNFLDAKIWISYDFYMAGNSLLIFFPGNLKL